MQRVIVKMTEGNTIIDENLKEYNMALTINLKDLWEVIQREAKRYEGSTYLYIQTEYIIPIKTRFFDFKNWGEKLTSAGGVTDVVALDKIDENRQIIVNAIYAGTYDDTRADEIISSAKIWLCELEHYEEGEAQNEIISTQTQLAAANHRRRKRYFKDLFKFRFFRKHISGK